MGAGRGIEVGASRLGDCAGEAAFQGDPSCAESETQERQPPGAPCVPWTVWDWLAGRPQEAERKPRRELIRGVGVRQENGAPPPPGAGALSPSLRPLPAQSDNSSGAVSSKTPSIYTETLYTHNKTIVSSKCFVGYNAGRRPLGLAQPEAVQARIGKDRHCSWAESWPAEGWASHRQHVSPVPYTKLQVPDPGPGPRGSAPPW